MQWHSPRARTLFRAIAAALLFMHFCHAPAWGQDRLGTRVISSPGEVRVDLRLQNSTAAPPGILVVLLNATRSEVERIMTDSSGKVEFNGLDHLLYFVKVQQTGYLETGQQADLTFTPSAHVQLTLIPIPGSITANASAEANAPSGKISAKGPFNETARKEVEIGQQLLESNKAAESLPHFQKAIAAEPAYANAYMLKGAALMSLNGGCMKAPAPTPAGAPDSSVPSQPEAESALQEAVKRDRKSFASQYYLGVCLNQLNEFSQAEKPLLASLELNPHAAEAQYELSRTYLALNQLQSAQPHALEATKLQPGFAPAHFALGNVYMATPDHKAAREQFETYLRLDPNGQFAAPAHLALGGVYLELRDNQAALTQLETYLQLAPNGQYAAPTREIVVKIKHALGLPAQ